MAEERLIDEDKDRRYKLRKDENGLEIDEETDFLVFEIPEDIEGGDVAYRAKIDREEHGKK